MRNLNEPLRDRDEDRDITNKEPLEKARTEAEVVPIRPGKSVGRTGTTPESETDPQELRSRWDAIQAEFVDDPRNAVQDADKLISSVLQRLEQRFSDERSKLEMQWRRGDQASTEDLRQALHQYRAMFMRLLSI
jgi:hypothetical protein